MKGIEGRPHAAFGEVYRGRRVLLTGHTGFKGSWLTLWLRLLGAKVHGYSLPPPTKVNHWQRLDLSIEEETGDVQNLSQLSAYVRKVEPEIVFHLAAQPIVRRSYEHPHETFGTNLMGTVNLLEACRTVGSARAIVLVTTDKVYENREWQWGYREHERLGGRDPYSASKACAENAAFSYRQSYWPPESFAETHSTLLATARAGNVIGGGDWAADRLVPDVVRSASVGEHATLRNPDSTRPWEHVLESLSGYLLLGQKLWEGKPEAARAWNFGPSSDGISSVERVVQALAETWPAIRYRVDRPENAPHEARQLTLDCTLAKAVLGWRPVWGGNACFEKTASWYDAFYTRGELLSLQHIESYVHQARALELDWTRPAGSER